MQNRGTRTFSLRPKADTIDPSASGSLPRIETETLTLRSALHSLIQSRGWSLAETQIVAIGTADHDQLEIWYGRALVAESLDQIFS